MYYVRVVDMETDLVHACMPDEFGLRRYELVCDRFMRLKYMYYVANATMVTCLMCLVELPLTTTQRTPR